MPLQLIDNLSSSQGDLEMYGDDMDLWFTSSVSFNPYQCQLLPLKVGSLSVVVFKMVELHVMHELILKCSTIRNTLLAFGPSYCPLVSSLVTFTLQHLFMQDLSYWSEKQVSPTPPGGARLPWSDVSMVCILFFVLYTKCNNICMHTPREL